MIKSRISRGLEQRRWEKREVQVLGKVTKRNPRDRRYMCASPEYTPLDEIDRSILQILQRDARHTTAVDISEKVDVSDGTVRNRIEALEQRGIIEGYVPLVNYEQAGFPLQIRIVCSASIVDREELAEEALLIEGVVEVEEVMTGRDNIVVTAVAPRHEDLTRIAKSLDKLGLDVEREELVRHHYFRPFNHFGVEDVSEEMDGTYDV